MPRVTDQDYLDRHHRLRQVWLNASGRFANLATGEQWDLHAYYVPSKDLSDEALLEHRGRITQQRRSLPAKAGKAFEALASGKVHAVVSGPVITKGKLAGHHLSVRAIVRPEPDLRKFAQALLGVAEDMARKKEQSG
jgi:hypothetical protein